MLPAADPRFVRKVNRDQDGRPEVWLEKLDTDEVVDDEAVAVEKLLDAAGREGSREGRQTAGWLHTLVPWPLCRYRLPGGPTGGYVMARWDLMAGAESSRKQKAPTPSKNEQRAGAHR